jgi:hypothetical protein
MEQLRIKEISRKILSVLSVVVVCVGLTVGRVISGGICTSVAEVVGVTLIDINEGMVFGFFVRCEIREAALTCEKSSLAYMEMK